jgi:hypothetical protein
MNLFSRLKRWLSSPAPSSAATKTTASPGAGPARLLILRHAEKTGDPADMNLSEDGQARAERLATYIPQTFGRPDFLLAAIRSKHSNRSYETLLPLSQATGLPIDSRFKDNAEDRLVEALQTGPEFAGKFGVVSWHHSGIGDLIAGLGAPPGAFPARWDPEVFNLIVELTFAAGAPPNIRQIVQPF